MLHNTVAAILRRWQADRGLTYTEIARRTGLSIPSVSAVLRGESIPRSDTLADICAALGRSEAELIRAMADMTDQGGPRGGA